jgi:cell division protein FtsI (penicillin-binding protein 3)
MSTQHQPIAYAGRHWLVLVILFLSLGLLTARVVVLQVLDTDYLKAQGDARYLRVVHTPPTRGMIVDRNGEPLAVSTPVDSVWAHPETLLEQGHSWRKLARTLKMSPAQIKKLCRKNRKREFIYLKRHLPPETVKRVMSLKIPGVDLVREYRRYYPAGPYTGHVLGFTNIDDEGQEGIELVYNAHLSGVAGKTRVLKDRLRRIVERVERIQPVINGGDLSISLDARIQFLAHRYLKAAVRRHQAKSASVVVLDVKTGEVLAMVNEPSFNPNNRDDIRGSRFRNRAVTDVFEPGSTIKPFTVAMALESGRFGPDTRVDTTPGHLMIGRHRVRDVKDYGLLTVSRVIVKSSNVGAAKIAMEFEPQRLFVMLKALGFGNATEVGLPGEVAGSLPARRRWRPIEQATLAFGYGLSATPLQLARAYAVLANGGILLPVSIIPVQGPVLGDRVMGHTIARQMRQMLEKSVSDHGTGGAARVDRYRVAGKTGTVHKVTESGYAEDRYMSVFAGMAPVSDPRLVMVVVVNDPRGEKYYGGEVAAPVFSQVMTGALRLMNLPPDHHPEPVRQAKASGAGA